MNFKISGGKISQLSTPGEWIKSTEWGPYKARITSLYLDENLTLADVMRIMGRDHGLRAT
jgi:hypothetical protein